MTRCPFLFLRAEKFGPVTVLQIDAHLDWRDERAGVKHTFSSTMRRASEMRWVEGSSNWDNAALAARAPMTFPMPATGE
jgi:arginase family enzyme